MGPPLRPEPVLNDHSILPRLASRAKNRPSTSPVKTNPPPVASKQEMIGYFVGTVHFFSPVIGSNASRWLVIFPPGGGLTTTLPFTNPLPSLGPCENDATSAHHSMPGL